MAKLTLAKATELLTKAIGYLDEYDSFAVEIRQALNMPAITEDDLTIQLTVDAGTELIIRQDEIECPESYSVILLDKNKNKIPCYINDACY
jgi:hypothetical protein